MIEQTKPTIYEFYESVLNAAGHKVKEDGSVVLAFSDNGDNALVTGKKLVLPLPSLLRHPDTENQIFFHPLCEQMTRYESEVFQYLKRSMVLKLMTAFSAVGTHLIKLQEDPAVQRKMNFDQINMMKDISITEKGSFKTSITNWVRMVMSDVKDNPTRMDKWAINIYLKRNGQFQGKSFRRVAVVSFPTIEMLFDGQRFTKEGAEGPEDLFRQKDYDMFKQVAKAIFPDIDKRGNESYNSGYDGTLAPYFIAFLRSYKILADRLNFILDLFKDPLAELGEDVSTVKINTQWGNLISDSGIDELSGLSRNIPLLKGNAGTVEGKETEVEEAPKREEPKRKEVERPAPEVKKEEVSSTKQTEEVLAALEKRRRWKEEQDALEELQKERDERRRSSTDRSREYRDDDRNEPVRRRDDRGDRDYRDRDDRRDRRDDRDDAPASKPGEGLSFTELFNRNPDLVRSSRTAEEEHGGRGRRSYRDDRDDRDYRGRDDRDSRDYRGRDDRDYRDSRDRDDRRGFGGRRDERDDRGYRDRDDRRDDRRRGWGGR